MRKSMLTVTAVAFSFAFPAQAQEQPPQVQPPEAAADRDSTANTTGGVTATGREILPDDTTDAPVDAAEAEAADAPEVEPAAGRPGNVVSPEIVEELYQMALEQQRKSAVAPSPLTDDTKAAREKAITAHRDVFFSHVEERS